MNSLEELKGRVKETLEEAVPGMQVFAYIPELLDPPAALIFAGIPYIEAANVYGHFEVRLMVTLVVPTGANDVETAAIDEAINAVIPAMLGAGFTLYDVGLPYQFDLASTGARYLGADLSISDTIQIKGE